MEAPQTEAQSGETAADLRADGALGSARDRRDRGRPEVAEVAQRDDFAVRLGEGSHRVPDRFALQLAVLWLVTGAVASAPPPGTVMLLLMALTILSFAALSLAQALGLARKAPGWVNAAFIHASNGFYANAAFNRLAGALSAPRS